MQLFYSILVIIFHNFFYLTTYKLTKDNTNTRIHTGIEIGLMGHSYNIYIADVAKSLMLNSLARIVNGISIRQLCNSGRSSIDLLCDIHWLLVDSHIKYNVALMWYKFYFVTGRIIDRQYYSHTSQHVYCQDKLVISQSGNTTSRQFSWVVPST